MRVALDGTPLGLSSGGLRRYTEELLRALRQQFPEDEYEALSGAGVKLWWSARLPAHLVRRGFHLFHGTNFEVPYLPVRPSVLTIHDLSPWLDPKWHSGADRVRGRTPILVGLNIPTMILTVTEAMRRQIIDYFRIPAARVTVVLNAPLHRVPPVEAPPPAVPYFLFTGTVEPRKNVPAMIDAWRPLRDRARLIIAGRSREDAPHIRPEPGLELRGEVAEEDLPALYAGATALIYPSLYEGFGLPVIEAMQQGTPVIASRDPALMEVSAGAAIHASDDELTAAMRLLLDSPEQRSVRRVLGLRRAAAFSWERTACQTREVYVEAIRRFAAGT